MPPDIWIEIFAFLLCLIQFRKIKASILKWFLPFLLLTNIVEWGNYFKWYNYHHTNNWIFNIFNPIEFCFYGFLYYQTLLSKSGRNNVFYCCLFILITYLVNILFIQGFLYFDSYSYLVGCLVMVYFSYLYFVEKIKSVEQINITKTPLFWISVGLLFFYSGEFILFSFFQYFLSINDFESFLPVFHFFSAILNAILYLCISISFFYTPKQPSIS